MTPLVHPGESLINSQSKNYGFIIRCCALQDGKVYTFGDGSQGQLGHSTSANEVKPKLVAGLDGPASQIACGR